MPCLLCLPKNLHHLQAFVTCLNKKNKVGKYIMHTKICLILNYFIYEINKSCMSITFRKMFNERDRERSTHTLSVEAKAIKVLRAVELNVAVARELSMTRSVSDVSRVLALFDWS